MNCLSTFLCSFNTFNYLGNLFNTFEIFRYFFNTFVLFRILFFFFGYGSVILLGMIVIYKFVFMKIIKCVLIRF